VFERIDDDAPRVQQARSGDLASFEALVEKYEQRLFGLALRMVRQREDAQEVVQETLLSAVEHLKDYRGESSFKSWLFAIATNKALHLLRHRRSHATVPLEPRAEQDHAGLPHPDYIARWRDNPERLAELPETRKLLDAALGELDEKYRTVFLLRDVEELSTKETALALGLSETNTKVRLLRARLMLRERLTRVLGDETTRMFPDHAHG